MAKAELVKKVAHRENITEVKADHFLGIFLDEIKKAVDTEEKLILRNFGTFTIRNQNERIGRNPKTGEPVTIKARRKVIFKAGKHFNSMVNSYKESKK